MEQKENMPNMMGAISGQGEQLPPFAEVEQEKSQAVELLQGVTSEEIKSIFFDKDALVEPPYRVFQLNSNGHRYYYRFNEDGEPQFYPSVTTILSQTMPNNPYLTKWIADKGFDEAEQYKMERANYGTFMHAQFEKLLIQRTYDLDGLKDELREYIEYNRLPDDFIHYADELKKDVLAFAQFVLDYDVRPLAVEIALVHPVYNYAGMIDLPCTMAEQKGSDKRITAIVDFKSGRKGFYPDYEVQLHLYKMMWEVNFEKHPIDKVFNFAPKDWRKFPTYHLKDQTDSVEKLKIPHLLGLAEIEDKKRDNTFVACSGVVSLDTNDLTSNVISLSLSELIKTKANKDDKPNNDKAISESDVIAQNAENERNVLNSERQTLNSAQKQAEKNESERISTSLKLDLSDM
jgi:hypothetical protein|nr:MAG TPA: Mitochondrial genome maintenance exonuclease 1, DNA complex, DNA exonuclease [Caudoviricetes sp.]